MEDLIVRITKITKFLVAMIFVIAVSTTTFAQQTKEDFYKSEIAKVNKEIAAKPNDDKLYVKRGELYLNESKLNYPYVIIDADKALKINPKNPAALKLRNDALKVKKEKESSLNNYFDDINVDSYFETKPESQGISALTKRIADNPQNSDLYVERGELYLKDKKLAEALADAEKALKIRPSNSYAMMLRSDVKAAKNDKSGADADFAKAVALRKESLVVGRIVSHSGKTLTGIVVKSKIIGNAFGYATVDEIKKEYLGVYTKVLIKDKQTKMIKAYEVVVTGDTEQNITTAETGSRSNIYKEDGILTSYEYMKTTFDQSMFLPKIDRASMMLDFEIIDILDSAELSMIRRQAVTYPPNDNALQDLMDNEITTGRFDEAKAIYLKTERLAPRATNQNAVKYKRQIYLRKLFDTNLDMKNFVEKEMEKYKFTEAEKKDVRTVKIYV